MSHIVDTLLLHLNCTFLMCMFSLVQFYSSLPLESTSFHSRILEQEYFNYRPCLMNTTYYVLFFFPYSFRLVRMYWIHYNAISPLIVSRTLFFVLLLHSYNHHPMHLFFCLSRFEYFLFRSGSFLPCHWIKFSTTNISISYSSFSLIFPSMMMIPCLVCIRKNLTERNGMYNNNNKNDLIPPGQKYTWSSRGQCSDPW